MWYALKMEDPFRYLAILCNACYISLFIHYLIQTGRKIEDQLCYVISPKVNIPIQPNHPVP